MPIAQSLLPEFEMEAAVTRKVLERVPEQRFDWKPHPKSFSMHDLAAHVANIFSWGPLTIATKELDVSQPFPKRRFETTAQLVADFDKNVAEYRAALTKATDAALGETWTFRAGSTVFFTQPKVGVLRGFVMNHLIHHRGQLSVYLRLCDAPVPSIYGPSADDDPFGFSKK
ncbi:MAG: DinB family protein [Planctomycetes bacterium]|nr:DinB family protein [Planctomycetota bacterium]